MKRIIITAILALMLSTLVVGPVSAQKGKLNVKGEVTEVGGTTLTVQTKKGETYVFTAPEGFDLTTIHKGDSVLVKAVAGDGGTWQAQSIKQVGKDKDDDDEVEDDDLPEGSKLNSAYCANGKQEKSHPLAAKMAERYGVTEEWVMSYFCDGYGMGAIMLALRTSQIEGVDTDPENLLSGRANGIGWGNLWKDLGLIGSAKNGHSPPGLLKKSGNAEP